MRKWAPNSQPTSRPIHTVTALGIGGGLQKERGHEPGRCRPVRGQRAAGHSDIECAGIATLQGIVDVLNARGIRTTRERRWYTTTVKNPLDRSTAAEQARKAA